VQLLAPHAKVRQRLRQGPLGAEYVLKIEHVGVRLRGLPREREGALERGVSS
jgi:hypothetical protein